MTDKNTPLNIAIIDDSEFSRNSIIKMIESFGHNVAASFSDPTEAIRSTKSANIDLFLIDIVMPEISGLEVAKTLNQNRTKAKIIMMSSLDSEGVIIDAIAQGAVDFLKKPFTENQLKLTLEKFRDNYLEGKL